MYERYPKRRKAVVFVYAAAVAEYVIRRASDGKVLAEYDDPRRAQNWAVYAVSAWKATLEVVDASDEVVATVEYSPSSA